MLTSTSTGPSSAATRATSAGAIARRIGEIGHDRQRDPAVGGDAGRDLGERAREVPARARLEAAGHDRDPRALGREPARDRRADAPARAGDDRNLAGQCIAHGGWTIVAWCRPVASSIASAAAPAGAAPRVALDVGPDLDDRDAARVRDVITHLLQRHDTTTERAEVAAIADAYSSLSDRGRVRFLAMLARDFWTDPAERRPRDRDPAGRDRRAEPAGRRARAARRAHAAAPHACSSCSPGSTTA